MINRRHIVILVVFALGFVSLVVASSDFPDNKIASASFDAKIISQTTPTMSLVSKLAPRTAPIRVVRAESLFVSEPHPSMFGNPANGGKGWTNANWLKSRFHFAFAEHRSGASNFGVLRVMNDDLVQPKRGFGTHGHGDMEIITYIVEGELTHQDSGGNAETLGPGSIQFMSAGTGVRHSERNLGHKPLRFIQSWVVPRRRGLKPVYGSASGNTCTADKADKWMQMVGDADKHDETAPVQVSQDVNVYATLLSAGKRLDFELGEGRQAYLLAVDGEVELRSDKTGGAATLLTRHDAAELQGPLALELAAGNKGAHLLLFEMAAGQDGAHNKQAVFP